jgi:hypothetical protein
MEVKLQDGTVVDLDQFDGYRMNNGKLIFIPRGDYEDPTSDWFVDTPLYRELSDMLKK